MNGLFTPSEDRRILVDMQLFLAKIISRISVGTKAMANAVV